MDKKNFIQAIEAVKALPKRKFKQSYDFIMNLRGLNLKKPEQHVEIWIELPHGKGRPTKIAAIVGPELADQAKANCDLVLLQSDFAKYAGKKKEIKKLAAEYDYFIAQANMMAEVAKTFGRFFGPRGRMPNPKAGCVVLPNANLKVLVASLKKTVKAVAKIQPSIKVRVGMEDMPDEQVAENMMAVYTSVVQKLPQETFNVKAVLLKMTMSSPVKITEKGIEKVKVEKPEEEKKEVAKKEVPKEEPAEAGQ